MGAAGSQRPPHVVDLRLEYPQATSSKAFFAKVHSEAAGSAKYKTWGKPQAVSLWRDDIITVTVYTADSEEDFNRLRREEFAEVYIPWSVVSAQTAAGVEVVFSLGISRGSRWLGHNAPLARYLDSFYRSFSLAEENPASPQLQIGIQLAPSPAQDALPPSTAAAAPQPTGAPPPNSASASAAPRQRPSEPALPVVGTSNVVASGVRELSCEEMRRLFQLQVRNQEMRAQIGLDELGSLEVEEQVEEHVGRLRQAVTMNYDLRAQQQAVDQELATMSACLTQEQRLIITDDAVNPPTTTLPVSGDDLDQAEYEQRTAVVMAEIQALTRGNIELISAFDQRVKLLEAQVLEAQEQYEAAAAPDGAGGRVELEEEAAASLAEASQKLEQQGQDLKVLEQEIEHLLHSLEQERSRADEQSALADRRALQTQEEIAQVKQTMAQEQALTEEQRTGLREELQALEDELQHTIVAKLKVEREIGEVRQAQEIAAAMEREGTDEQLLKESLEKELSRTRCRIGVCEEKIERLKSEATDIRARAVLVLQAAPDVAGGRSPRTMQAMQAEALVQKRQEELQLACSSEQGLRLERDEAQQALESAKVEAAVVEQKMRLLRGRQGI